MFVAWVTLSKLKSFMLTFHDECGWDMDVSCVLLL